jgi:hypothetical protein
MLLDPRFAGSDPPEGCGFLKAIKIRSTPSLERKVNLSSPCRKILRHVKEPSKYERDTSSGKIHNFLCQVLLRCCWMALLVELPQSSGEGIESFSFLDIVPPWLSMLTYHVGVNKRPVGGRSSET